jgi:hypothetical protein
LAIKTGPHAFYAARLPRMVLREDDLRPVSPQHQNVSLRTRVIPIKNCL